MLRKINAAANIFLPYSGMLKWTFQKSGNLVSQMATNAFKLSTMVGENIDFYLSQMVIKKPQSCAAKQPKYLLLCVQETLKMTIVASFYTVTVINKKSGKIFN